MLRSPRAERSTGVCRNAPLSTGSPHPLSHQRSEREPWSHAAPGSRGVGRPHRCRGPVRHRGCPRCWRPAGAAQPGASQFRAGQISGTSPTNARYGCGKRHPGGAARGLRLAFVPSACGPSPIRTAREPVVARAPRRRPVGGRGPTSARRRRRRRGLLRRDRRPWRGHRSASRWAAHDLRTGGRPVGIRQPRSSGHQDRRRLPHTGTLHATSLSSLGRRLRAYLSRSIAAAGIRPPDPPAARLRVG